MFGSQDRDLEGVGTVLRTPEVGGTDVRKGSSTLLRLNPTSGSVAWGYPVVHPAAPWDREGVPLYPVARLGRVVVHLEGTPQDPTAGHLQQIQDREEGGRLAGLGPVGVEPREEPPPPSAPPAGLPFLFPCLT